MVNNKEDWTIEDEEQLELEEYSETAKADFQKAGKKYSSYPEYLECLEFTSVHFDYSIRRKYLN